MLYDKTRLLLANADRAAVLLSNRADFTGRNIAGCMRSLGKLESLTGFRPSQARPRHYAHAALFPPQHVNEASVLSHTWRCLPAITLT